MNWGSGASAHDRLFAESSRFDFFQAVRILTWGHQGAVKNAFAEFPVRFRASMGFDFPAGDIAEINLADNISVPAMTVHFLGLAGAHGPLPATYTESLLRPRTSALRDFLDIFHHRLILLLYRVHQMHHPTLAAGTPDESLAAHHLYAILGLGRDDNSALRQRRWFRHSDPTCDSNGDPTCSPKLVPNRALLYYGGLIAHRSRSASGLQRLLSDYFGVDVAVDQFVGAWLDLAEDQWTCLGAEHGRNQALGEGALLGRRVWDEHASVTIKLGPLDLPTFENFLPGRETAYELLYDLTRFYLGSEIDFQFRLLLRGDQIPEVAASSTERNGSPVRRAELGRISWLESGKNRTPAETASPVSITVPGVL
jgi:type VI secretion system protein ImpH